MTRRVLQYMAGIATVAVAGALCASDSPTTANATVEIPVQHLFRGKKLELFTPGSTLVDGTNIEITRLEYLISNVRVQKADGAWIDFPNQYFHINAEDEKEAISLAGIDAAESVRAITLTIGVEEKINHANSSQWPAGHALNPLENNLNWDWTGGYVFLALEGRVHSSDAKTAAFLYHIGNDQNRMDVSCALPKAAPLGDVMFAFHVDEMWDGPAHVSCAQDASFTHSRTGDELASKLVKNARSAFRVVLKSEGSK